MAFGAPFPGGGLVTGAYQSGGSALNSATISGLTFGPAAAGRYLIAIVYSIVSTPTSLTFNPTGFASVLATRVGTVSNSTPTMQVWIALVPNGTAGTISLGHSGNDTITAAIYQTTGGSTPFAPSFAASVANPWTSTPAVPGGAFVIGGAGNDNAGAVTWSGITADATQALSSNRMATASGSFPSTSAPTITATQASSVSSVAMVAVWAP